MAHKGEKSNGSHYTSTRRSRKQVKKNMKRLTVESMKHKPKKTVTSLQKNISKIRDPEAVAARKKIRERKYKEMEGTHRYATPMDNKKRKYKGKYSSKKGTDSQWVIFN